MKGQSTKFPRNLNPNFYPADVAFVALQYLQRPHEEAEWEALPLRRNSKPNSLPGEEELSDLDVASLDPTAGFIRMLVDFLLAWPPENMIDRRLRSGYNKLMQ